MKRRRSSSSKPAKSNKRTRVDEVRSASTNESEPYWSLMIPEILLRIFGQLDYYSLRKSASVCRLWMQCANDESLAVMHLLDTRCEYNYDDEYEGNYVKKSIRVKRNTGEYDVKQRSIEFSTQHEYFTKDYIEIRSEVGEEFERWQVFLRYNKVKELLKRGKQISSFCLRTIRKLTNTALAKDYETVFLESSITKSVSSQLKSKLEELKLTDHQLEAISWMLATEKNKAQIEICPVVPVPNSPLLLELPDQHLILPNEVHNTKTTFESSNRIIFAKSLKCAALELIGLMLASKKRDRTIIVTETAARAKIWQQHLAAAPALKVIEVEPNQFQNMTEYVHMMVSLTDMNKNEIYSSLSAPYTRIVYDNVDEVELWNEDVALKWCIRIVSSAPRLSSDDPLVSNLFSSSSTLFDIVQDENDEIGAYKYLRHFKLVPKLIRNFVWINQGIKLKIYSRSE